MNAAFPITRLDLNYSDNKRSRFRKTHLSYCDDGRLIRIALLVMTNNNVERQCRDRRVCCCCGCFLTNPKIWVSHQEHSFSGPRHFHAVALLSSMTTPVPKPSYGAGDQGNSME